MFVASLLTGGLKQVRDRHLLWAERLQKDAFPRQKNLQQSPRLGTRSLSGMLALSCPIHWHLVQYTNWKEYVAFTSKDSPVTARWLILTRQASQGVCAQGPPNDQGQQAPLQCVHALLLPWLGLMFISPLGLYSNLFMPLHCNHVT